MKIQVVSGPVLFMLRESKQLSWKKLALKTTIGWFLVSSVHTLE
jgi:hypothetical protein